MARQLNGSTQYLSGTAPSLAYPFSVAVWFKTSSSGTQNLWAAYNGGADTTLHVMGITWNGGDAYVASSDSNNAGGSVAISSGSLWTTNTWNLAVGVWAAADDRKVYVNGSSGVGSSTVSRSPSGINTINLGREHQVGGRQYVAGPMCEYAVWNAALTAANVNELAAGFSPQLIRPDSLATYHKLLDDDGDRDWWGKLPLSPQNTPTYATHPPIIYPSRPRIVAAAGAPVFPTGWSRRVAIVIDYTKVGSGGVSDFDVALTRDCLPNEMCSPTDGNAAQADGGDVRFSSDEAGTTQLACDIIKFEHDTTDGAGDADILIRVLVPSVSSASDTTIYAWYKTGSTESQPAASDTYGSDNAYDANIEGYWPFEEDPSGSAPQMLDRTANSNDGTSQGSMTSGDLVAAKLSNGLDLDGSNDHVRTPEIEITDQMTLSAWVKRNSTGSYQVVFAKDLINGGGHSIILVRFNPDSSIYVQISTTAKEAYLGAGSYSSATDYHLVVTFNAAGNLNLYINGSYVTGSAAYSLSSSNQSGQFYIGADNRNEGYFPGVIDEPRFESTVRSAAWITTRYNNEADAGAFAVPGTPASVSALSAYPTAVLADTPAAYYRLGEASGTTAADSSGNAYDGTYVGTVALGVAGLVNDGGTDTAASFTQNDGAAIEVGGLGTLGSSIEDGYSFECVIQTTKTDDVIELCQHYNNAELYRLSVSIQTTTEGEDPGTLLVKLEKSSDKIIARVSIIDILDGNPHHLIATVDPTTATVTVYVDDEARSVLYQQQDTVSSTVNFISTLIAYQSLGSSEEVVTLDEIAIYNKVLDATDASEHYTASGLVQTSNGRAWWFRNFIMNRAS